MMKRDEVRWQASGVMRCHKMTKPYNSGYCIGLSCLFTAHQIPVFLGSSNSRWKIHAVIEVHNIVIQFAPATSEFMKKKKNIAI